MEEHEEFVSRFQKQGDVVALGVDFRKKHGVLEAVNKSMTRARDEEKLLEDLRKQQIPPILPQDVDGIVIEADEDRLNPDVQKRMDALRKSEAMRREALERGGPSIAPGIAPEDAPAPPAVGNP